MSVHVGEACGFADGPGVWPITLGQRQRAESLGWRFTSLDADLSSERQVAQIDELVALGVDALTSYSLDAALAEPAYERAVGRGIPVVTFASDTPCATTVVRQAVDSHVPAADAAAYLAERAPAGRILVVGGPPVPALAARTDHFLAAARDAGLEVLAREDNVGDVQETAVPIIERLLDRCAGADAVWCFNDHTAVAAGAVLRRRGMAVWSGAREGVMVSGLGGTPAAMQAVRAGDVTLTYDSLPVEAGRAAIDALAAVLVNGERAPAELSVDCIRYDAANADEYVPWSER